MLMTIQFYLKAIIIKLIVLVIAYSSFMAHIVKYISKIPTNAIFQLHYHHPRDWKATYASGAIEDIVISKFFVSQLVLILTINNLKAKTKHNEIIFKDQMTNNKFNKLYTAVHFITYTRKQSPYTRQLDL